ncbi:MAG: methyl-accepting chemotaxis protein [Treponema sp.]|nr:methyl-accepting chemotaxis protein [Treponema sp.]
MKSLRKEFLLLFIGVGFLISCGVGLLMYYEYHTHIQRAYRKTITQVTDMLVRVYPQLCDFEYLAREGSAGTSEYWRLAQALQEIVDSFGLAYISVLEKRDEGYIFVIDNDLENATGTKNPVPGTPYNFSVYATYSDTMALAERSGVMQLTPKPTTDEYGVFISSVYPIMKNGAAAGIITVDMDVSVSKNLEQPALIALFISLAVALGASLIAGFTVSDSLVKPIRRVTTTLQAIAEGNLTVQISDAIRKDEFGAMMRLLNRTQSNIKTLVKTIADKAESLSHVGSELSSMVSQSAAAVRQIDAQTRNLKAKAGNQAAGLTRTNNAMKGIVNIIEHLNRSVEEEVESVSRSSSAIEEMAANVTMASESLSRNERNIEKLIVSSEKGYKALRRVSDDIQEVAKESGRLLEINTVIENIASQTNLLSMNAAIEAAHAGESGKGFAVVASEIRKLAESSSKQAGTVAEALKKIKGALDGIRDSTERTLIHFKDIDSGVHIVADQEELIRRSMEEQNMGNQQILMAIAKSQETTQNVRDNSDAMLAGSGEVVSESRRLEALTVDLDYGMDEIAAGMNQINAAVARIQDVSIENKDSIAALTLEIGKFTL